MEEGIGWKRKLCGDRADRRKRTSGAAQVADDGGQSQHPRHVVVDLTQDDEEPAPSEIVRVLSPVSEMERRSEELARRLQQQDNEQAGASLLAPDDQEERSEELARRLQHKDMMLQVQEDSDLALDLAHTLWEQELRVTKKHGGPSDGHGQKTGTAWRPWNAACRESTEYASGKQEYRKIVVMAMFPWLCHNANPPGHMTLLYWLEQYPETAAFTQYHVDEVERTCKKFHRNCREGSHFSKYGDSFLYDAEGSGGTHRVDPCGPIGELIAALSKMRKHASTCGSGLNGLHITAGLDESKRKRVPISEIKGTHAATAWLGVFRREAVQLSMNLLVSTSLAPRPCNEDLFEFCSARPGGPGFACHVAKARHKITSVSFAKSNRPLKCALQEYFRQGSGGGAVGLGAEQD